MKLVLKDTETELVVGETYKTFRGEDVVLNSIEKPHSPASTGRVHTSEGSFFPSVIGAEWIEREDR